MSEATEAKQELIDEGFEASFGDYAKDSEGFDTDVFVEVAKFFILEGDWQKDFSDDVRASDVFIFAPYDINLDTMPIIVFDSKEYRIIKPKRFKEKGDIFLYELQIRA